MIAYMRKDYQHAKRELLNKAEKAEARYSVDLDDAAEELHDLEIRAAGLDPDELLNDPKPDEKPRSVRKRLEEKQAEMEQRERTNLKKKEKNWER